MTEHEKVRMNLFFRVEDSIFWNKKVDKTPIIVELSQEIIGKEKNITRTCKLGMFSTLPRK